MAIEVVDELQHSGIGTRLATRLIERAQSNGIDVLAATTLRENQSARALARRLGFLPQRSQGAELELELPLAPPAAGIR
jgi:L-amino acid N-acyltransferase YncA